MDYGTIKDIKNVQPSAWALAQQGGHDFCAHTGAWEPEILEIVLIVTINSNFGAGIKGAGKSAAINEFQFAAHRYAVGDTRSTNTRS